MWGLATSTRLLRGDEEAGHWELLASGQTSRSRAAGQALAGLGAGVAVLWAVTVLITAAVARYPAVRIGVAASLYFALALVASAVLFLAVGAVTSQLAATRRQAAGCAAAVPALSYGMRMVADAGAGLRWLVWASPLGWVEQAQPLTHPAPGPWCPSGSLPWSWPPWPCISPGSVTSARASGRTAPQDRRGCGCFPARPGWPCA